MPRLLYNSSMDRRGEKRVSRRDLGAVRELAVNAMQSGMHPDEVAKLYDVGRSSVYNWRKEYLEKGTAAFVVKFAPGWPDPIINEKAFEALGTSDRPSPGVAFGLTGRGVASGKLGVVKNV